MSDGGGAPKRKARGKPQGALASLLSLLDLETLEVNLFRGHSPSVNWGRVYGGQVLAQSLVAAGRTIAEPRPVHSMHAYFLLAGNPGAPIVYEVERVRDGGSFTTRRVKAIQAGRAIFVMSASFQKAEAGFEHQSAMPQVPGPEELPSEDDIVARHLDRLPDNLKVFWARERPIEMRVIEIERYLQRKALPPAQHVWIKARGLLPDDPQIHSCILAYASDFTLLDTALMPHGKLLFDTDVQLASLDHAMWLHRPFRADEWLLYATDSPSASGARGFCRGSVYRRDGTLVASVTQEGLTRRRDTAFVLS